MTEDFHLRIVHNYCANFGENQPRSVRGVGYTKQSGTVNLKLAEKMTKFNQMQIFSKNDQTLMHIINSP
jgi:hypothetical protein